MTAESGAVDTWLTLKEFGFQPDSGVYSDVQPGLSFDLEVFRLSASCVLGRYFTPVVLFTGVLRTPRILAEMEFELPRVLASSQLCAALLAYYIDQHGDRREGLKRLHTEKEIAWLLEGRQHKHLLPWEIERANAEKRAAAYNARPKCTVEREWLKLALKKLNAQLSTRSDDDEVKVSFDGSVLSFEVAGERLVVAAEGSLWPSCAITKAGVLRELPKRLMSNVVDVSLWEGNLYIDRYRYRLLPTETSEDLVTAD